MFKCEIKTGGAAFRAENYAGGVDRFGNPVDDDALDPFGSEVRRILRRIITDLGDGKADGVIMDSNGNKVGTWSYD